MKQFNIKTDTGNLRVQFNIEYFDAEVNVTVLKDSYTVRMSTNQLANLLASAVLEHLNDVTRIQTEPKNKGDLK